MSEDSLGCIESDIAEIRAMMDEYKAIVERDWALQESHLIHGRSPVGILLLETNRRVVVRWLASFLVGVLALVALAWLAAESDLSAWIDRMCFAFAWIVSSSAACKAHYDGKVVARIIRIRKGIE